MIIYSNSNLLLSPAQALVNTVNTVGVMGAGLAKAFKMYYPQMFKTYRILCQNNQFKTGQLMLVKSEPNRKRWVLNFPTKKDWRNKSQMSYVESGLKKFVRTYKAHGIESVAFPPLGAGLGGLDDKTVNGLMVKYLGNLDIPVYIHKYKPSPNHHFDDSQAILANLTTSHDAWKSNLQLEKVFSIDNNINCDGVILPESNYYKNPVKLTHCQQLHTFNGSIDQLVWLQKDTALQ